MRAFERLHPADGLRFEIRSEIPLARGLGSSAAAIVAGLIAADHLFELGLGADEIYRHAVELEGHPDNVAAALYGGFVVCPAPRAASGPPPVRLDPPKGVEAVLVDPGGRGARPTEARAALPAEVPIADAVANLAAASQLVLGIERSDLDPDRAAASPTASTSRTAPRPLPALDGAGRRRPRSWGRSAPRSPAPGPTVLVWCFWQDTGKVADGAPGARRRWAEVRRAAVQPAGRRRPGALGQTAPAWRRIETESE